MSLFEFSATYPLDEGRGGVEVGKLAQGIHWLAEGFGLPSGDKAR
jgi:hypothetical protein